MRVVNRLLRPSESPDSMGRLLRGRGGGPLLCLLFLFSNMVAGTGAYIETHGNKERSRALKSHQLLFVDHATIIVGLDRLGPRASPVAHRETNRYNSRVHDHT